MSALRARLQALFGGFRRWYAGHSRRDQNSPLSARLSDSVPPEVKTTSPGRQFSACAIVSRDSSTTRRALRPLACSDDGLPTSQR